MSSEYMILGISFNWERRKGLDVFLRLANELDDRYRIVLVGTNAEVDKLLPNNIISIHHTADQQELSEIYSAADVFINPTREDNFPTVNIEALACGTPVITFRTGGSEEIIDKKCGIGIDQDNYEELIAAIVDVCEKKKITSENCVKRSTCFDRNQKFLEYVELYKNKRAGIV